MSRPIKYMAWDKRSKKLRVVAWISFQDFPRKGLPVVVEVWGKDIIEDKDIILRREVKDVELMQFTGLHDKGGKEIYEGYICAFVDTDGYRHQWPITWNPEKATFWYGHLPIWSIFESGYYQPVDGREPLPGEGFEVVGNIYENPELLK